MPPVTLSPHSRAWRAARRLALAGAVVAILAAGCGEVKVLEPSVPSSFIRATAGNLTAVIGGPVAVRPSVLVRDLRGRRLPGVQVTFAVASGGGVITGAVQTTDVNGLATVGSWTLGPAVGTNTLTATVADLAPVLFAAEGILPGSSVAEAVAGDGERAATNGAVEILPTVLVRTAAGAPLADVPVTFTVAGGGGLLTGSDAVTDRRGLASPARWTLGAIPGENVVRASIAGLPDVVFRAVGYAPPSTLTLHAGNGQSGATGGNVAVPPAVIARDLAGQPVANVPVDFTVSQGSGVVRGPRVITNAQGIAAVAGWTLGLQPGAQALTARSGALTPVVITANATGGAVAPCEVTFVHAIGSTNAGTIGAEDCASGATLVDVYRVQVGAQQNLSLRLGGAGLPKYLAVLRADGSAVSELANPTSDAAVEELLFLGTGTYVVRAGSIASGAQPATGAYMLTSSLSPSFDGCWNSATITPAVTIALALTAVDCAFTRVGSVGTYYNDAFDIVLEAGARIVVRLESSQFDPFVEIRDARDQVLAFDDNSGGGNTALLTFTAPARGYFTLKITSAVTAATGAYTLTVTP